MNGLGSWRWMPAGPPKRRPSSTRAANADPSNASYWTNLGNARREEGDLAGAESAYRRALEADPKYADAANGLGVMLVQQRKPADAIVWFQSALQRSPDFHEARLNLGIAYQESGDRDRADCHLPRTARRPRRLASSASAAPRRKC